MGNTSLCAKFQVYNSLRTDAIVFSIDGRTDGRNFVQFRGDKI